MNYPANREHSQNLANSLEVFSQSYKQLCIEQLLKVIF